MVRIIAHVVGNLPTNFGVSGNFRSRLIGQHLTHASRDIATLTFDLGAMALVGDTGPRAPYVYQV